MKRKITAVLLLLSIILALICCAIVFNKAKEKKFTFWTIQLKPIYEKEINEVIQEFNNKHPEYKVVWVDIPIQEAQKRILASILSSTPPDLVNLNPDFSLILAQKNTLEFFSEKDTEQFLKPFVNHLKYDGKIYALPFYATSPVTIYNKKIYDTCNKNGFIKTYDELFETSPKLKACSKITPFVLGLNENDTLAKILNKYDIENFENEKDIQETIRIYSQSNVLHSPK